MQILSTGTSLMLQRDNLLLYSSVCPSSPVNTYKNGKLSQSFGHNFLRDLGGTLQMAEGATTANCPQQRFVRGTALWATRIDVQKDAVVFQLYCTPDGSAPYYGDLRIPFEKGSFPTPDQALARIAEVLTVQQMAAPPPTQTPEPPPPPEAPPPPVAPPPPPPAAALRLPSTYVSAQAQTDRLQLNADHSFSLQEGGQPYRGSFTVNGNTLALNIADGPTTTVSIEGINLKDSSGQTWVFRDQPAQDAPGATKLQDEDIIKLVKAGFDDGTIIAKISSSRCQFDTSTDALIRLKRSGVSAAVLKAMVAAK
jgi:hypothetical protein